MNDSGGLEIRSCEPLGMDIITLAKRNGKLMGEILSLISIADPNRVAYRNGACRCRWP